MLRLIGHLVDLQLQCSVLHWESLILPFHYLKVLKQIMMRSFNVAPFIVDVVDLL